MIIANTRAQRMPYPAALKSLMNIERARESRRWLSLWKELSTEWTPLYDLPGLARRLGVARVSIKDESVRSPLGSFKALGAPIALVRQILRRHPGFNPREVLAGRYAESLKDYTVISATDGNHGRSLAAAARDAGCRCQIVLHANVSKERESAIAAYGAEIIRIRGGYDDSVEEASRLAAAHGWQVISDTSYEGYEEVPCDVMQGYSIISEEIIGQTSARHGPDEGYTHVFLQGGVGGFPAGVACYFWEHFGERRPHFIVVEPQQADCLLQSVLQSGPARTSGSVDSVMAGLACGDASPLAWRFLEPCIDHFMTVEDRHVAPAMRLLALGCDQDVPIVAGESGVAGLVGLQVLRDQPGLSDQVGLDASSRVLLINTEGATAPGIYQALAGEPPHSVLKRQAERLAAL